MAVLYDNQKVTLYYTGEFLGNIVKLECKLHELGTKKYAQYDSVPYCIFTKKRSRTKREYLKAYKPKWIVVDGWDNPSPESKEITLKETDEVKVSTYSCNISNPQEYTGLLQNIPKTKVLFAVGLDKL